MKNFVRNLLVALISRSILVASVSVTGNSTLQSLAPNTCADPSLGVTYIQAYSPSLTAHALNTRPAFANVVTNAGQDWQFDGDAFLAWTDPQEFTVPLYRFFDATTKDYLYTTSTTGSPPSVPGFTFELIVAYVYQTQVCGSVPLLGSWSKGAGDHFYTTSQPEHAIFSTLSDWTDSGIAAYVLPANSDCACGNV